MRFLLLKYITSIMYVIAMYFVGAEDILDGNMKLILGLIWHLIMRYQIKTRGRAQPKKLMLAWINAVLRGYPVSNFTTEWNDGIALQ